jgi:hypothetical protein
MPVPTRTSADMNASADINELQLQTVPVGTLLDYAGATAPTGFLLATKATPESIGDTGSGATKEGSAYLVLYTLLWDTAGTTDLYAHKISSGKGANAAADFTAGKTITINYAGGVTRAVGAGAGWTETTEANTLGVKQDDAMQGHHHGIVGVGSLYPGTSGTPYAVTDGTGTTPMSIVASDAATDGTNGTPRTAKESRMKNIGVHKIIKY